MMPNVAVLMATYNGERYLKEQVSTIQSQIGVRYTIFVSDDFSTDATLSLLEKLTVNDDIHVIPISEDRFGTANGNFLKLISSVDVGGYDYVALSDQDDLWRADKLTIAIREMQDNNADCFSSDVIAFWPNGRRRLLKKSRPQKKFDYLFESPGPGCTFVFTLDFFKELQYFVRNNFKQLLTLKVHDWTIYAFARSTGYKWFISSRPTMYYRQHSNNEIGANFGISAIRKRLSEIVSGKYIISVKDNASVLEICSPVTELLNVSSGHNLLRLSCASSEFRRDSFGCFVLRIYFLYLYVSNALGRLLRMRN